jgi:hypothetical protein
MALTCQLSGIGWIRKIQQHRANYFLTIPKEVVVGNGLRSGDSLHLFLLDAAGRKALLIYLDMRGLDRGETRAET